MEPHERELLGAIAARASELCAGHDPAHDVAHVRRVVNNAKTILKHEDTARVDEFVTLAACWLHDIVQLPKGSGPPGESARRSAAQALEILAGLGVDPDRARHIADAVRTHSYSGGERPATLEAAIVQDADRLDALGAVGLARMFAVAGELRSSLYHPDDPLARDRPLDDRHYALDHIDAKLLNLPALMTTATARRVAKERAAYLLEFREQLIRELVVGDRESISGESRRDDCGG